MKEMYLRDKDVYKVSIIVVNWRGERLVGDCLGSLSQQTYSEREMILVDNGSTNQSIHPLGKAFRRSK